MEPELAGGGEQARCPDNAKRVTVEVHIFCEPSGTKSLSFNEKKLKLWGFQVENEFENLGGSMKKI